MVQAHLLMLLCFDGLAMLAKSQQMRIGCYLHGGWQAETPNKVRRHHTQRWCQRITLAAVACQRTTLRVSSQAAEQQGCKEARHAAPGSA